MGDNRWDRVSKADSLQANDRFTLYYEGYTSCEQKYLTEPVIVSRVSLLLHRRVHVLTVQKRASKTAQSRDSPGAHYPRPR